MSRADKDVDGILDARPGDPADGRDKEGPDPGAIADPAEELRTAEDSEPVDGPEATREAGGDRSTESTEDPLPEPDDGGSGEQDAAEGETQVADEFAALQDRFVRQAAEFQNYRRRTEAEKTGMVGLGKAMVVQQLLDVLDDLERSLEAARAVGDSPDPAAAGPAFDSLRQGVELVYTKFRDELARVGVEPIESVGKPFDEHAHDAMMQQPAAEGQDAGIVVGEIQKGYRMGDRVLRHARVIVSA